VAALKVILEANKPALGNFTRISERDEDPAVVSNSGDMPILVVIPLADRPDRMRMSIGSTEVYHDFSIVIIGYYLYNNLDDEIKTLRGYGYACFDLFRGTAAKLAYAHVYSASLDVGYFVMVDYPIYRWILTLNAKMIEP
jgi:hypothetical protein